MSSDSTPAVRLLRSAGLEHTRVPVPKPAGDEVLLRILAVGLCGSDAHWFEEGSIGDAALPEGGLILGHEFSAVIESGSRTGERVAVDPAVPCLNCISCSAGRFNLCLDIRFAGHGSTDGALRGQMVWPERCLVPVPAGMSDEGAALLEPLGVALHAIDLALLTGHPRVGVIGCGPIGLLLIGALQGRGVATVVTTDRLDHRRVAAERVGADESILATEDQDEAEALSAAVGGGLDVVFETSGTETGADSAILAARPGGRVVMVGIPARDRTSFAASAARRKELTIQSVRRMLPFDLHRAADLAGRSASGFTDLITHTYPLAAAEDAFQTLVARTGIKVVVTP